MTVSLKTGRLVSTIFLLCIYKYEYSFERLNYPNEFLNLKFVFEEFVFWTGFRYYNTICHR